MSGYNGSGYYSDETPRRRSHRSRRPIREETIIESRQGRNGPPLQQALVRRPRSDSSDSIEEIEREFDPESGTHIERRNVVRDRHGNVYNPPRPRSDVDYSQRQENRRESRRNTRKRRDSYDSYDSYDSESESSRSRPPPRRRPSMGEKALAAIGLSGAAGAIANRARSKSRARSRSRQGDRDRSSSRDSYYEYRSKSAGAKQRSSATDAPSKKTKFEDAAKAAIAAAAVEAWRARREPGNDAGKRILTAAIAAAGVDAAVQQEDRHGNRNAIASAIGGVAANRLINGPRSRSRSRAGGRGGPDDFTSGTGGTVLSVAALAALAGKAIKDHRDREKARSRSRPRGDRGSDSYSDEEEEGRGDPYRRKSLSEHLHGPLDRVLETMGLPHSDNHRDQYYVDKYGRRHYSDDEEGSSRTGIRGGGGDEEYGDNYPRLRGGGGDSDSSSSCSTDSYSSEEETKKLKGARRRELITGGLAAVATIHAVAGVHKSIKGREARHKKVLEGKMTPEEARRLKSRAALQDAAAIGLAALGLKGAYSEWKEVREIRGEEHKRQLRLQEMREHRQAKYERGEWNDEVWRKKRSKRSQSHRRGASGAAAGAAAGAIEDGDRKSQRSSSRPGGRYIEGGRARSRGRSQSGRGRRYSDEDYYYSSDADDDDRRYRDPYESRRGSRRSLPPNFNRGKSYYADKDERYASPDAGPTGGRASGYTDEAPYYTDGNPYGGTSQSSQAKLPLSSRLPPPPVGYSHAPRY